MRPGITGRLVVSRWVGGEWELLTMALLLLLQILPILPLLAQGNNEECHTQIPKTEVEATLGSTVDIKVQVISPVDCEVTSEIWYKTDQKNPIANYDFSARRWTIMDSVQYQGRVQLSPGFNGVVWLRLQGLRMEDAGIYLTRVTWRYGDKTWTDSDNVRLIVINPCQVNISKTPAVVGMSMSFTLTKAPPGCRLMDLWLQNLKTSGEGKEDPVEILTWSHNSGLRKEHDYAGRVAVKSADTQVVSVELMNLTCADKGEMMFNFSWEFEGKVLNVTMTERVLVRKQAVSKPHILSKTPSVREGEPLVLRCILPQGSPPIIYTWLLKNQSSGLTETEVGVEVETWTVHDARDGDMVACDVSNTVNGERKNLTSDFVRLNVTKTSESNFPGIPHYIIWSPVLIILMLAGTTCLCVYHRMRGKRQRPSENMYDNVGTCAEEPNAMEMSRLRQTDDAETSPVSRPQRAGQGSVSLAESEYEDLRRVECVYDRLGISPALPPHGTPSAPPRRCRGDRAKTSKHVNLN